MLTWFANFKLIVKLVIPTSILVAVTLGIVWYAKQGIDTLAANTHEIVDVVAARRATTLTIAVAMNDAAIAQKNVLLETDAEKQRGYAEGFRKSIDDALKGTDKLITLAESAERRAAIEQIKETLKNYEGIGERANDLAPRIAPIAREAFL